MSKYTTEIRFICETEAGYDESQGYLSTNEILKASAPKIFNFDFPMFDEAYRMRLEVKILKHYYTREIGLETVGLFKLKLDTKLNEIMPYYNQLYKSALLDFNPLYDVDITRTHNRKNEGTQGIIGNIKSDDVITLTGNENQTIDHESDSTSTSNGTNQTTSTQTGVNTKEKRDLYSDTPQGALTGVETENYLSNARKISDSDNINQTTTVDGTTGDTTELNANSTDRAKSDRSSTTNSTLNTDTQSNTTTNNLEDYIEVVKGKQGTSSYASLLKEFRETFLNIDMMVINELSDLFMQLW